MRFSVRAVPRSSQEKIVIETDAKWKVYVREAPERGRANKRLEEMIAERLGVPKRKVRVVGGIASRMKTVEVDGVKPNRLSKH